MKEEMLITECECDGWKYRAINRGNGLVDFEVLKPGGYSIPESLFKMYGLSANSLDAILNGYLYVSHPNELNDIYDCHTSLIDFDDYNMVKLLFSKEYSEKDLIQLYRERNEGLMHRTAVSVREMNYKSYGIVSLTNNPNNIQMWSYYTNHEGFLIEFRTNGIKGGHGPFPINYQEEAHTIKFSEVGSSCLLYQCGVKHIGWKHENEWRLFVYSNVPMESKGFRVLEQQGGKLRRLKYGKEIIKSISLGSRFFAIDEMKQINNIDLEIILDRTNEAKYNLKKRLLEFALNLNVKLLMALNKKPFILEFAEFIIAEKNEDRYILRMIPHSAK